MPNTAADPWPSDLQAAPVCLPRLLSREGPTDGLWARLLCASRVTLPSATPLCAPEGCITSAPLPASLSLGSANDGPWQKTGMKKNSFLPARLCFGRRQSSCLLAPLSRWQPPLPLVPAGLIYMDCSSGLSQPLASPWAPDRGKGVRSWHILPWLLPPVSPEAGEFLPWLAVTDPALRFAKGLTCPMGTDTEWYYHLLNIISKTTTSYEGEFSHPTPWC